jgi:hypothetical protein
MKKYFLTVVKFFETYHTPLLIVSLSLLLLWSSIFTFNYQGKCEQLEKEISTYKRNDSIYPILKHQYDSISHFKDSLETEIFILETEATRHQITRDEIFYKYPLIGEEYYYFISHYTE